MGINGAKEARRLLELCVEAGVNLVDTANFYSQGRSEEILGEALENQDRLYDKIELLVEIAEGYAVSAAEVALAWLLTRPAISSLIIGARTEDQLHTNLRCVDLKLSQQDIEKLEAISRPGSFTHTGISDLWRRRA